MFFLMQDQSLHPHVGIIIPCYNQAHFLAACLESVMAQTYPHWEAIIVNDSSPDADAIYSLVASLSDQRIALVSHSTNRGLAAARNTGIRSCTHTLVVCVDADDLLSPNYLEACLKQMNTDPHLECVFGNLQRFGESTALMICEVPNEQSVLMNVRPPGAGTLMKKCLWERVGGYDESDVLRAGCEDWDFYIRAFNMGCKASRIDEPLYLYRTYSGSMMSGVKLHNEKIRRYLYNKYRNYFHAAGLKGRFLAIGYDCSARNARRQKKHLRCALAAFKACCCHFTLDRLKLCLVALFVPWKF
jgi:O-antigen biosynthesis protein